LIGLSSYSGGRQGPQETGCVVDGFSSAKVSSAVLVSVGGMDAGRYCSHNTSLTRLGGFGRPHKRLGQPFMTLGRRCRLLVPITEYPSYPDQRIAFVVLGVAPIIEDGRAMRILADGFSVF